MDKIAAATQKFALLIEEQLERVRRIKDIKEFINYAELPEIIIGVAGGDGIGPAITAQAQRVLEFLLAKDVSAGKVSGNDACPATT